MSWLLLWLSNEEYEVCRKLEELGPAHRIELSRSNIRLVACYLVIFRPRSCRFRRSHRTLLAIEPVSSFGGGAREKDASASLPQCLFPRTNARADDLDGKGEASLDTREDCAIVHERR